MEGREKILVSACLLGELCRYDGRSVPSAEVMALGESFELVPVCPEQLGGLPTPRVPCELQPDGRVVVPSNAVVVAGSKPVSKGRGAEAGIHLYCPVIVKYRDEKTAGSIHLEELLR